MLFSISLIPLIIFTKGLIEKPHSSIFFRNSDCSLNTFGSIAPKPYAKYFNGIFEVSFGSFCLNEPPAAFRGFAKFF